MRFEVMAVRWGERDARDLRMSSVVCVIRCARKAATFVDGCYGMSCTISIALLLSCEPTRAGLQLRGNYFSLNMADGTHGRL